MRLSTAWVAGMTLWQWLKPTPSPPKSGATTSRGALTAHSKEDQLLVDVADLKRKLHRIIYKSRDKSIKGAGEYPYPKMLFFHETSHQGTGQFHTHLITEKMPKSLNTQDEMETLFHKRLPHEVKALSKWKSIDIQRISQQDDDYRRISSYLGKQTNLELIALDPFNSDLSPKKK